MAELPRPVLCLVASSRSDSDADLLGRVDAAITGGVNVVQLREPAMSAGRILELAVSLRSLCGSRALLFINDRVDVAIACGADGVQLGEAGLPVDAARRVTGPRLMIGRSVHTVEGVRQASGADMLVLGTIFDSASHPGVRSAGPGLVRSAASATDLPIIGIGGITALNAGAVMQAGAVGVAVVGAILGSSDPRKAALELRRALEIN
ncbi:MAG: thiamine phosphate synthase [SAR202 cluster bacterium]|nr:thiamine phosphate synthase [SAR202 cluster bacterium]